VLLLVEQRCTVLAANSQFVSYIPYFPPNVVTLQSEKSRSVAVAASSQAVLTDSMMAEALLKESDYWPSVCQRGRLITTTAVDE